MIEGLLCSVNNELHISEILNLLFAIRDALFSHVVTYITLFVVDIIAWNEYKLKSLVANCVIFNTPDRQFFAVLLPI